jgi:hypothetical protein
MAVANETQLASLAAKLIEVPDIDDHWVMEFLDTLSKRMPDTVVDLILARVEREEAVGNSSEYEAVPFQIERGLKGIADHPRAPDLLRKIAQAFAKSGAVRRLRIGRMFEGMSAHLTTPASIELLTEMSRSADAETVVDAAALFRHAGQRTFFSRIGWVIELLQHAATIGAKCFRNVSGYLHEAATCGTKHGTPGEPFPADLALKQRAATEAQSLSAGSPERRFFDGLAQGAEANIRKAIEEGELLDD